MFVITGVLAGHPNNRGDEDAACADYVEALLRDEVPDPAPFIRRVFDSDVARIFADPARPKFPPADLELATAVDRFDFAMLVQRRNGQLVMKPAELGEVNQ